ncbi:MAG TPA: PepSY domain-containing protein [Pyrinomonadaceae bacterium]|jgi:uncharacterized membrane protein YkoI
MKHKIALSAIFIVILAAGAFAARPAKNNRQEDASAAEQARLSKQTRITMEQARAIALKRAPGNIEGSELEREHGKLVYSFDIRNDKGTITEVQVNAKTGRIVSVEEENAKQEAEEKRKEEQEKTHKKRP